MLATRLAVLVFAAVASLAVAQPQQPIVRQEVHDLTASQVESLRRGVAEMKRRSAEDPDDPTGWDFQVATHMRGSCGYHATSRFLFWHRLFLYHFEQILREAAADPTLAVPYWDYTDPQKRAIPESFRDEFVDAVGTDPNPLFHPGRQLTGADRLSAIVVDLSGAMNTDRFSTDSLSQVGRAFAGLNTFECRLGFGGLEQAPHNLVHNAIGGDMQQADSPRDPLFWLHHAMIDRVFEAWLSQHPAGDPMGSVWFGDDLVYEFPDASGQMISYQGSQVLSSAQTLGYEYDNLDVDYEPREPSTSRAQGLPVDEAESIMLAQGLNLIPDWRGNVAELDIGWVLDDAVLESFDVVVKVSVSASSNPGVTFELGLASAAFVQTGDPRDFSRLGTFPVMRFLGGDGTDHDEHESDVEGSRFANEYYFDAKPALLQQAELDQGGLYLVVVLHGPNDVVFGEDMEFTESTERLYGQVYASEVVLEEASLLMWELP